MAPGVSWMGRKNRLLVVEIMGSNSMTQSELFFQKMTSRLLTQASRNPYLSRLSRS